MEVEHKQASFFDKLKFTLTQRYRMYLDKVTPHAGYRWAFVAFIIFVYILRVYLVGGFYIVTYALGIYLLNLLIGFLAPKIDPETILNEIGEGEEGEEVLPTKDDGEFRPFIRKVNEFKFWFVFTF